MKKGKCQKTNILTNVILFLINLEDWQPNTKNHLQYMDSKLTEIHVVVSYRKQRGATLLAAYMLLISESMFCALPFSHPRHLTLMV